MTISAGVFTFGAGGDYPSFNDALIDIAAILTGNLTLNQVGDTTNEPFMNRVDANSIDLNGFDFLIDNLNPHNGVVGAGHIIDQDNAGGAILLETKGSGNFEIRNVQFFAQAPHGHLIRGGSDTFHFHDVIIDGNGADDPCRLGLERSGPNCDLTIRNILHMNSAWSDGGNLLSSFQINGGNETGETIISDISMFMPAAGIGLGYLFDLQASKQVLQNIVIQIADPLGICFDTDNNNQGKIPTHCASTDGTAGAGLGCINNLITNDAFDSIEIGDEQFGHVKAGGPLDGAGNSTDASINDITGSLRADPPTIGAYSVHSGAPCDTYTQVLQSILPLGKLFNRMVGTTIHKLLCAFSFECKRIDDSVVNYINEIIPDKSTLAGLLTEWERAVGIPNECVPIAATEDQRRANVLFVLSDIGGNSIPYWENRAEAAGFPGTVVTEQGGQSPFIVGISVMGDPLGDTVFGNAFTWIVTFPVASVGTSAVECDFERNKPAHTQIIFVNTG